MPTQPTPAGARTSRALPGWLAAAVCVALAHTAHAATSVRSCSPTPCRTVATRLHHTVALSDFAVFNSADTRVTGGRAMPRSHALVSRPGIRTRRFFQGDHQHDSSIAGNHHVQLSLWGALVAPRDAVRPVIFLSPETTRGPPRAGAQSPLLCNGARDRSAPPLCAGPPPSEFILHDSSSARNATCLPIRTSLAGRMSASLVAASLSAKHHPGVHPQDQPDVQPALTNLRNNTKES